MIVLSKKDYLYTSTLGCNWASVSGCRARVYDTGVKDGKQSSGISNNFVDYLET